MPLVRMADCALHVGGQNGQPSIRLHALQEIADLNVGISVMAILDLASLPEEGISLSENNNSPAFPSAASNIRRSFSDPRYIC